MARAHEIKVRVAIKNLTRSLRYLPPVQRGKDVVGVYVSYVVPEEGSSFALILIMSIRELHSHASDAIAPRCTSWFRMKLKFSSVKGCKRIIWDKSELLRYNLK